jgi:hypothetical protein
MLDISLELKGKGGEIVSGDTLAACLRRYFFFPPAFISHHMSNEMIKIYAI